MKTYKVWDPFNGSEENAKAVKHCHPKLAAIEFAEVDCDGATDGIYYDAGCPIDNLQKDGIPILVKDEDGNVYRFKVGVVALEPIFLAVEDEAAASENAE